MEIPKKISRTIFNTKTVTVKIVVPLKLKDGGSFYKITEFENEKYLNINGGGFVSITKTDIPWSSSNGILLSQYTIHTFVHHMKEIIHSIYKEKLYAFDNKELIIYKDMADKATRKFRLYNSNMAVIMRPTIVYDDDEVSYEGVSMYLNKWDNNIDLPIEVFEALYNILSKVDLFAYSQMLINCALMLITKVGPTFEEKKPFRNKIEWNTTNETVKGGIKMEDPANVFSGL